MSSNPLRAPTRDLKTTVLQKIGQLKCETNPAHNSYDFICCHPTATCTKLICMDCSKSDLNHIETHGKHFLRIPEFIDILSNPSTHKPSQNPITLQPTPPLTPHQETYISMYNSIKDTEERLQGTILNYNNFLTKESQYLCQYLQKIESSFVKGIGELFSGIQKGILIDFQEKSRGELGV